MAETRRRPKLRKAGANCGRMRAVTARLELDTAPGRRRGWRRTRSTPGAPMQPLEDVLVRERTYGSRRQLRIRLLAAGLLEYRCAVCAQADWRRHRRSLELDHVYGDASRDRLENLRVLRPNCHSQTPTYRDRNIGRGVAPLQRSPGGETG